MPASFACDMCGDELAVAMVTSLANGDTLAVGEACQLTFHLAVATELVKVMPSSLAGTYDEQMAGLYNAHSAKITDALIMRPAGPVAADTDTTPPPPPAEGPEDEHAETPQDQPAGDAATSANGPEAHHRPRRGSDRRPG